MDNPLRVSNKSEFVSVNGINLIVVKNLDQGQTGGPGTHALWDKVRKSFKI